MKRYRKGGKWHLADDFVEETAGFCAAAAIANACRAVEYYYKYNIVTETIAATAMRIPLSTIETGADERDIKRGLHALGFMRRARNGAPRYKQLSTKNFTTALHWLERGYAIIAITHNNSHWATIVLDDFGKILVINSENNGGTLQRISRTQLEREWRTDGKFYGIGVKN